MTVVKMILLIACTLAAGRQLQNTVGAWRNSLHPRRVLVGRKKATNWHSSGSTSIWIRKEHLKCLLCCQPAPALAAGAGGRAGAWSRHEQCSWCPDTSTPKQTALGKLKASPSARQEGLLGHKYGLQWLCVEARGVSAATGYTGVW